MPEAIELMMNNEGNQTTTVLICTLNEEKNLPYVLPKIPEWVDEVIIVDGHSTDKTVEVSREIRPDIKVFFQPGKGKGDALRHGFSQATGDIIVTLDADGSMEPKEIEKFVLPLRDGYEFSKGSRFTKGGLTLDMERHRIIANRIFSLMTNVIYGTRYTDLAYGYNAIKKDALSRLSIQSDGFEIETEINIQARKKRLKTLEIPSIEQKRISGSSNLNSFKDGWRILKTIIKERFKP